MNNFRFVASILLGTVLWIGGYQSASAQACEAIGDGVPFTSIQEALDMGHLQISFTGTCPGFVIFGNNNTSINGDGTEGGATSIVDGAIFIFGASNVVLQDFTIKPVFSDPLDVGILMADGSFVRRIANIVNKGVLLIFRNSGASLLDTRITAPGGPSAVRVLRNSFLELQQGNFIEATGPEIFASVIVASDSSLMVQAFGDPAAPSQIVGAPALRVARGSIAEIRQGDIVGDVIVDLYSMVSIGDQFSGGNASVSGNHTISRDSALVFEVPAGVGTVTFDGTVTCLDDESSVSGSPSGTGIVLCTGFDQVAGGDDDGDDDG